MEDPESLMRRAGVVLCVCCRYLHYWPLREREVSIIRFKAIVQIVT